VARSDPGTENKRLALKLLAVTFAMFGFGYALVPLYDVFCDVTGLNGKTGRIGSEAANRLTIDRSRSVTVEFVTNVNAGLPWDFRPTVTRVTVHPGSETEVTFEAVNHAAVQITGHAVPSVAPNAAARYFNKTECFCFTEQRLDPGESRRMPVRFIVDPKLPENIEIMTLAYTFFEAENTAATDAAVRTAPES